MNTTLNYSLNFDPKKRKKTKIKFIVFHYTGMKKELDAIKKLTHYKSKVSSHYFIKKNGEILTLLPDLYVAWHAGVSCWQNYESLNKYSIGIEISNPGHNYKYLKFTNNQIRSVVKLSKYLIKKYKIKSNFILGHSDIAPSRKKDPGEKFPWKYLSKRKIGYWHDLDQKKLKSLRNQKLSNLEKMYFLKNLYRIGYEKYRNNKNIKNLNKITLAFQRRFRQSLIDGIVDKECLKISENLIKKIK